MFTWTRSRRLVHLVCRCRGTRADLPDVPRGYEQRLGWTPRSNFRYQRIMLLMSARPVISPNAACGPRCQMSEMATTRPIGSDALAKRHHCEESARVVLKQVGALSGRRTISGCAFNIHGIITPLRRWPRLPPPPGSACHKLPVLCSTHEIST
jgi:hypothetical protein